MAFSSKSPLALFLIMNLVFFAVASASTCNLLSLPLATCGSLTFLQSTCCSCFSGLSDVLDAAACLCAAIKANVCVLGVGVDATAYISATLGKCGYTVPSTYTCA